MPTTKKKRSDQAMTEREELLQVLRDDPDIAPLIVESAPADGSFGINLDRFEVYGVKIADTKSRNKGGRRRYEELALDGIIKHGSGKPLQEEHGVGLQSDRYGIVDNARRRSKDNKPIADLFLKKTDNRNIPLMESMARFPANQVISVEVLKRDAKMSLREDGSETIHEVNDVSWFSLVTVGGQQTTITESDEEFDMPKTLAQLKSEHPDVMKEFEKSIRESCACENMEEETKKIREENAQLKKEKTLRDRRDTLRKHFEGLKPEKLSEKLTDKFVITESDWTIMDSMDLDAAKSYLTEKAGMIKASNEAIAEALGDTGDGGGSGSRLSSLYGSEVDDDDDETITEGDQGRRKRKRQRGYSNPRYARLASGGW